VVNEESARDKTRKAQLRNETGREEGEGEEEKAQGMRREARVAIRGRCERQDKEIVSDMLKKGPVTE
jgi:hypothetical protein